MEVSFSSTFKCAFKKRIQGKAELEPRFWQKLDRFTVDSFDPSYFGLISVLARSRN